MNLNTVTINRALKTEYFCQRKSLRQNQLWQSRMSICTVELWLGRGQMPMQYRFEQGNR